MNTPNLSVAPDLIAFEVAVDRSRNPQAALDARGLDQYGDRRVVAAMPKGEGDTAQVVFFEPDLSDREGGISDDDLEQEFVTRGLINDPIAVIAFNEAHPGFADDHPNCAHWRDAAGRWCYVLFRRFNDSRRVYCDRHRSSWYSGLLFAGIRKQGPQSQEI